MSREPKLHMLHAVECSNVYGIKYIFECGLNTYVVNGIPFTNDPLTLDNRPPETVCKKCLRAVIKMEQERMEK